MKWDQELKYHSLLTMAVALLQSPVYVVVVSIKYRDPKNVFGCSLSCNSNDYGQRMTLTSFV